MKAVKTRWNDIEDALENKKAMDKLYKENNVFVSSKLYISSSYYLNVFVIEWK